MLFHILIFAFAIVMALAMFSRDSSDGGYYEQLSGKDYDLEEGSSSSSGLKTEPLLDIFDKQVVRYGNLGRPMDPNGKNQAYLFPEDFPNKMILEDIAPKIDPEGTIFFLSINKDMLLQYQWRFNVETDSTWNRIQLSKDLGSINVDDPQVTQIKDENDLAKWRARIKADSYHLPTKTTTLIERNLLQLEQKALSEVVSNQEVKFDYRHLSNERLDGESVKFIIRFGRKGLANSKLIAYLKPKPKKKEHARTWTKFGWIVVKKQPSINRGGKVKVESDKIVQVKR